MMTEQQNNRTCPTQTTGCLSSRASAPWRGSWPKIAAAVFSLGLMACGGTADTNLEAAFCAGLGSPAVATVTAAEQPQNAPPAALGDQATEIALNNDGTQNGGSIVFAADEAGHFAFGLDTDVPFAIIDSMGQPVALVRTVTGSEVCTELAVRHTALLEIASYTITFGPSTAASIKVVAEESNDDLLP